MVIEPDSETEKRVLLVAPTAKDGQITHALLTRAGLACVDCKNIRRLVREVDAGAGAILLTEESITGEGIDELLAAVNKQPPWSDLPVVIMMKGGALSPSANRVLCSLRNVTLLERPAPTRSVVSAVQAAVRGRERQCQIREQIKAIRCGEQRMRRLVESNIIGVTFCDRERILEANDAFLRIVGYTREDVEARRLLWRKMTPSEYTHLDDRAMHEIADRGACSPFEKEYICKDGGHVHVLLGIAGLEEDEASFVCFVQDLTERKHAERERSSLLESERAARSEAERAGRMKDEFLATLSHELRTPLNAILGWSQLMRQEDMEPDDLKEGLDVIERNARAQTELIEDLLDMSRIISGKVRLDVQTVDPVTFIESALETLQPAAAAKGIKLEKVLNPLAGPVTGDPHRLQQVMWNLIANAVKFTPRGGKVQVILKRVNSHIHASVADTGMGIHPDLVAHVFERFRQADSSTTREHRGLGLGLAIVKHLVELHGGTVGVESPGEGRGATFTVQLPVSVVHGDNDGGGGHHSMPVAVFPALGRGALTGVKLLVVDDELDSRDLLRRVLEKCGAAVLTAGSAAEALHLLEIERPDVLVSDIGMPEMDGYELLRRVRTLEASSGGKVPAVALTAFARSEDRLRALRAGYLVRMAKPVQPSELIATIATVAGRTA